MEVLLICGGKSYEREISLQSAKFIAQHIAHNVHVLVIEQDNLCQLQNKLGDAISKDYLGNIQIIKKDKFIGTIGNYSFDIDIVFPIMHGRYGEDGTMQGWLELLGVPYVGCGILSSAICMDKDISKNLVSRLGIRTAEYITLYKHEPIAHNLSYPIFVKPANNGSSIGIYKVNDDTSLESAIEKAFLYDQKIIIEQSIENAREIEVAILQSDQLIVSMPGEIIVNHEFYSYEAKYLDPNGAKLNIPASLAKEQISHLQSLSQIIFRELNCSGMARVDFLMQGDEIFFNEINTIPGFTNISLYPSLLKYTGISYTQMINILLENALSHNERHSNIAMNHYNVS